MWFSIDESNREVFRKFLHKHRTQKYQIKTDRVNDTNFVVWLSFEEVFEIDGEDDKPYLLCSTEH